MGTRLSKRKFSNEGTRRGYQAQDGVFDMVSGYELNIF